MAPIVSSECVRLTQANASLQHKQTSIENNWTTVLERGHFEILLTPPHHHLLLLIDNNVSLWCPLAALQSSNAHLSIRSDSRQAVSSSSVAGEQQR